MTLKCCFFYIKCPFKRMDGFLNIKVDRQKKNIVKENLCGSCGKIDFPAGCTFASASEWSMVGAQLINGVCVRCNSVSEYRLLGVTLKNPSKVLFSGRDSCRKESAVAVTKKKPQLYASVYQRKTQHSCENGELHWMFSLTWLSSFSANALCTPNRIICLPAISSLSPHFVYTSHNCPKME